MGNEQSSSSLDPHRPSHKGVPLSNPRNNHDDRKVRHSSMQDAIRAKQKMIEKGKPGATRLTSYYNEDTKGYYNGKSKYNGSSSNFETADNDDGAGAAIMLVGLFAYGVFCAGKWAVEKISGDDNSHGDESERQKQKRAPTRVEKKSEDTGGQSGTRTYRQALIDK
mmetsp:Transcript_5641/g.8902  ORF Transcript_5641/g.8902 Transcript_5641/m.8902 type:complete len:166 (+) Transcript_5641:288-785(+)